jgi:hypothetical protein
VHVLRHRTPRLVEGVFCQHQGSPLLLGSVGATRHSCNPCFTTAACLHDGICVVAVVSDQGNVGSSHSHLLHAVCKSVLLCECRIVDLHHDTLPH